MASYSDKIRWWSDRRCEGPHVKVTIMDRYPVRVQSELEAATVEMDRVLKATGYEWPTGPTGSYNCRQIGGSTKWSLHAYAIAIDIDYGNNPYLRGHPIPRGFVQDSRFQLTEANVDAVEAIRNDRGESIWKWLGWSIGDTMHFEADVPPDRCQPVTDPQEDDVLKPGDTGLDVAKWQNYLNRWSVLPTAGDYPWEPLAPDGQFGGATEAAVMDFQRWSHIEVDGIIDLTVCMSLSIVVKSTIG